MKNFTIKTLFLAFLLTVTAKNYSQTKTEIDNETSKKYLPLILGTAIFMQMLDSTILNTSLPAIAKDLKSIEKEIENNEALKKTETKQPIN